MVARFDLSSLLAAAEESPPVGVADAIGEQLLRATRARHTALLIANFSGDALVRLSHVSGDGAHDGHNERAETVPLRGTAYEQVVFSQVRAVVRDADGWLILAPITERGDAIGILEAAFAEEPDAGVVAHVVAATHAFAYVLIASRRHTDLFEWAQRDIPFSISAEIQRRLLPPSPSLEAGPLTLAGWLEPSHEAGGDTFDYCLDREYLYVSLTDAMGHGTRAALLATLAVAALRNRRRTAASPAEQADAANHNLRTYAGPEQFVTGLVLRIRLADGATDLVNAGHPAPFLVRDRAIIQLESATQPPFGVLDVPYRGERLQLKPGDRLLLVTDGYLDRSASRLDIDDLLAHTMDRHPRQIVRELAQALLRATGRQLEDDATCLCLDWQGPDELRHATGGASQARATPTD